MYMCILYYLTVLDNFMILFFHKFYIQQYLPPLLSVGSPTGRNVVLLKDTATLSVLKP